MSHKHHNFHLEKMFVETPAMTKSKLPQSTLKTLVLICFISFVAIFDFAIYMFMAEPLGRVFQLSNSTETIFNVQFLSIFAAGFLARPIGAYFIGRYGDKVGRKRAVILVMGMFLVTTLVTACLPTYSDVGIIATVLFVLIRLIQGVAFGSQFVLSWVYVTESLPSKDLTMNISFICISIMMGCAACAAFTVILYTIYDFNELVNVAWRYGFVFSVVLTLIALSLCRRLQETPQFIRKLSEQSQSTVDAQDAVVNGHSTKQLSGQLSTQDIISPLSKSSGLSGNVDGLDINEALDNIAKTKDSSTSTDKNDNKRHIKCLTPECLGLKRKSAIVLSVLLSLICSSLMIINIMILPALIDLKFSIAPTVLHLANIMGIMCAALGLLFYGWLGNKVGVGIALRFGAILLAGHSFVFFSYLSLNGGQYIVLMYALFGFCSGIVSLCIKILVQLFPIKWRLTYTSTIFNTVTVFTGIILPYILFHTTEFISFSPALYIILLSICTFIIGLHVSHSVTLDDSARFETETI